MQSLLHFSVPMFTFLTINEVLVSILFICHQYMFCGFYILVPYCPVRIIGDKEAHIKNSISSYGEISLPILEFS